MVRISLSEFGYKPEQDFGVGKMVVFIPLRADMKLACIGINIVSAISIVIFASLFQSAQSGLLPILIPKVFLQ